MRVLRIFVGVVVGLALVGLVSGLIGREILLSMGVNQLRAAARELRSLQGKPDFIESCLDFGGAPFEGESLTRAQLRFLTDQEFVVEIVCQPSESLRQIVRAGSLPVLVKKTDGQSGLIQGANLHGITLSVLGRTGAVYEEETFIHTSLAYNDTPSLILDDGPATVCEGYGFQCCSEASQVGQDLQETNALDCPRSCYAQCIEKPIVLNFSSDFTSSDGTRVITARPNEPVPFTYTVNDIQQNSFLPFSSSGRGEKKPFFQRVADSIEALFQKSTLSDELEKIVITFGDGESAELSDLHGTVSHTYTCFQSECLYNATIQAVTRNGITSTLTDLNRLQVLVQQ